MSERVVNNELWLKCFLRLNEWRQKLSEMNLSDWPSLVESAASKDFMDLARDSSATLKGRNLSKNQLAGLYGYVLQCEEHYLEDMQRRPTRKLAEVTHNKISYRAWPTTRKFLRDPPEGGKAPASLPRNERQLRKVSHLKFRFLWGEIDSRLGVSYARSEELAWHRSEDQIVRVAVVPLASIEDVKWRYEAHPAGEGRRWVRAESLSEEEKILERLSNVLAAAKRGSVDILIFPELVMSDPLVDALRSHLDDGSDHPIKLVVAGSWHAGTKGNRYSNRSRVFTGYGTELWMQEKTAIFDTSQNGAPICEPSSLGTHFAVRDSDTLGRLAVVICSDFCNRSMDGKPLPIWQYLQQCTPSLVMVPTMQHDGNLERFRTSAHVLRDDSSCATVVCNIFGSIAHGGGAGDSAYAWLADSREANGDGRNNMQAIEKNEHLLYVDVLPIDSH